MSHLSILQTRLTDKAILIETLQKLGYTVREGESLTITAGGKTKKVDFLIDVPYSDPIGFKAGKNGYQLVADWFKIQLDRKTFQGQLLQQYAYESVTSVLREQGYQLSEERLGDKQQIHLVARRMS